MQHLRVTFDLLCTYLVNNIGEIWNATIWASLISIPSILINSFTNWSLSNEDYVRVVLIAIIVDHALGTYTHLFIKRDFSILKNMGGMVLKLFTIICVGLIFEGLGTLLISHDFIYTYLITVLHIGVFIYPAKSALLNSNIITKGIFPGKVFIKFLSNFSDSLDISDLDLRNINRKQKTKENDTNISEVL